MLTGGGRALEDLRMIHRDQCLRSLLHLDHLPSSDAAGDWLRRTGEGLTGLDRVNRRIVAHRLRKLGRRTHTLGYRRLPDRCGERRCGLVPETAASNRSGSTAKVDRKGISACRGYREEGGCSLQRFEGVSITRNRAKRDPSAVFLQIYR